VVAAGIVAAAIAAALALNHYAGPMVRDNVLRGLSEKLGGEVTIEQFEVRLVPPSVSGRGLVVRHRGRTDIPPLISIAAFAGTATSWRAVLGRSAAEVTLEGLEIVIPPREPGEARVPIQDVGPPPFTIGRLNADNARLTILPRDPKKDPRVFDIHELDVRDLTFVAPSTFDAVLSNPVPFGLIETSGSFGPWVADQPSATPLAGEFTFDADLGTIKGIAGRLAAEGRYTGPFDRIGVTGTTSTADFRLPKLKGHAMPLETKFEAVVDATKGDVLLERVDAMLGRSRFISSGAIVGTRGIRGKRVVLQVRTDAAHLEDVLRLTVAADRPPLTGQMALETSFDLPQGDRDVVDKLLLEGKVTLKTVRFTSESVQDKVDDLSRRGQGRPGDEAIDDVMSNVAAGFDLRDGNVRLTGLRYQVQGATVEMEGVFTLPTKSLDFTGVARLDASMSATQTGLKRFLLKPLNPLFRKDGAGTRLAIKIGGTIDDPQFGLDIGRTLSGK
jgi:hypothetical protein